MKPDVLILDEPTAGLDPAGRDEILGLVSKMHRNLESRFFWYRTVWKMWRNMWIASL